MSRDATTVSELRADAEKEVRIVTLSGGGNPKFDDGIVREVKCVNADEDIYAVTLYSPVYRRETVIYPKGSALVTVPSRIANAVLAAEGQHERDMEERKPGWGA
ncbi:hypothetical protein OV450_3508 [Actinobacteria bacterium OV450]|nr:hypothetical protein OV450_3508 [Actinobacteria bacterium OV450]